MTASTLLKRLDAATSVFDWSFNSSENTDTGYKLSLQGKSTKDAAELYSLLKDYLYRNNIPFKVATCMRTESDNKEQRRKVMTIYIPNQMNVYDVAEEVYTLSMSYKGWHDIKTPTSYEHYAGCVFVGNDRVNGQYIPAINRIN